MTQSWESYIRQEELRELGNLIKEGFCPVCEDEEPTLIFNTGNKSATCKKCNLTIYEY